MRRPTGRETERGGRNQGPRGTREETARGPNPTDEDEGNQGGYRSASRAPVRESKPGDTGTPAPTAGTDAPPRNTVRLPRGYITEDVPVTTRQRRYLDRKLTGADVDGASARLFYHVVHASTSDVWASSDEGVPVYYRLITGLPGAGRTAKSVYEPLLRSGLLRVVSGSYKAGRSNTYAAPLDAVEAYVELGLPEHGVDTGPRVRLMSGRPTVAKSQTVLYDANGNQIGADLWTRAMRSLRAEKGLFRAEAVGEHLRALKADIEAARLEERAHGEAVEGEEGPETRRRRLKYVNDARCYAAVCGQGPTPSPGRPGVFEYALAYRHQRSGRAGQVGGGLQSCSREMKAAAYRDVPGVHNYDVRASQANFLVEEFAFANGHAVPVPGRPFDPSWVVEYVGDPEAKRSNADRLGVDVDVWKRVLYALLMGARLPTPAQAARSEGDVVKTLRESDPGSRTPEGLRARVTALREIVGPFYRELGRWHGWLDDFARSHRNYAHGRRRVPNLAGEMYEWSPETLWFERRSQLAAHRLQGREAAFVLNLILQARPHGFRVLSHEHDGLVTLGVIPEAAVEAAKAAAGVERVVLVEKPFC